MSDYEIISIVLMFINTIVLILINKDKKVIAQLPNFAITFHRNFGA